MWHLRDPQDPRGFRIHISLVCSVHITIGTTWYSHDHIPLRSPENSILLPFFLGRRYRHLVQFSEAEGGPAISASQLFGSFIRATSPMISPISPEHFMGKFSPRHGPSTPILSATGVRIYSSTGPWRSGDGGWLGVGVAGPYSFYRH